MRAGGARAGDGLEEGEQTGERGEERNNQIENKFQVHTEAVAGRGGRSVRMAPTDVRGLQRKIETNGLQQRGSSVAATWRGERRRGLTLHDNTRITCSKIGQYVVNVLFADVVATRRTKKLRQPPFNGVYVLWSGP